MFENFVSTLFCFTGVEGKDKTKKMGENFKNNGFRFCVGIFNEETSLSKVFKNKQNNRRILESTFTYDADRLALQLRLILCLLRSNIDTITEPGLTSAAALYQAHQI